MSSDLCCLIASTPENAEHFFGYHDLCPWNVADDTLIALRLPLARREARAQVCLWKPDNGQFQVIGETAAWNWQQGARAQWLPGRSETLVYNTLHEGRLGAIVHDVNTGKREPLPDAIYDIHPNGTQALTLSFARLNRYWSSYGYLADGPASIDELAPTDDGIWGIDFSTGQLSLLVSIAAVANIVGPVDLQTPHFLAHPTFNPSGSHFCFMDRFIASDGSLYSSLFVADRDGQGCRPIAEEKVSHFDWYDDDTLLVWTRRLPKVLTGMRSRGWTQWPLMREGVALLRSLRPRTKQRLFGEAYHWLSRTGRSKGILGAGDLDQDGHPMFLPGTQWLVTDTYPDRTDGSRQRLILYDIEKDRCIDIATLRAVEPYVLDAVGDKCDLHPRWNRAGTRICVDSSHTGTRQMHIFDVTPVVGAVP